MATLCTCHRVTSCAYLPACHHFLQFMASFPSLPASVCRCGVVERRARHELERAKKRLHLVDGYLAAMADLDAVVATIRQANDAAGASQQLQVRQGEEGRGRKWGTQGGGGRPAGTADGAAAGTSNTYAACQALLCSHSGLIMLVLHAVAVALAAQGGMH